MSKRVGLAALIVVLFSVTSCAPGPGPEPPAAPPVSSEGRLWVFGAESHGAYAEAFRLEDGQPLPRFCTCYWFNFSERWKL